MVCRVIGLDPFDMVSMTDTDLNAAAIPGLMPMLERRDLWPPPHDLTLARFHEAVEFLFSMLVPRSETLSRTSFCILLAVDGKNSVNSRWLEPRI